MLFWEAHQTSVLYFSLPGQETGPQRGAVRTSDQNLALGAWMPFVYPAPLANLGNNENRDLSMTKMPMSRKHVNGAMSMPSFCIVLKITASRDHRSPISLVRQALERFDNMPNVSD